MSASAGRPAEPEPLMRQGRQRLPGRGAGQAPEPVALVLGYPWLAISTPPIMTALYLAGLGHAVDIFVDPDPGFTGQLGINIPHLNHPRITIRATPSGGPRSGSPALLPDGRTLPPEHQSFVDAYPAPPRPYGWLVGFDPAGLLRAAALAGRWNLPFVYHSLEIAAPEDPLKELERICNRAAILTISQDPCRAGVLAQVNGLDPATVAVARNSSMGQVLPAKSDFFRVRFPVGERRIVLGVGTLSPAHCVDTLLAAADGFPEEYVLVLHGWLNEEWFRPVARAAAGASERIFLSETVVPPEEKFAVFQGADVGLVCFAPLDLNMRCGAASAGKYYDFLRCGVPVIGNDLPGMREMVEGDGCGLVVEDMARLGEALPALWSERERLRANCLKTFPRYEFSASYAPVLERIKDLAAQETARARA